VGRERELLDRAAHAEGGTLTPDEREQVFAAIMRVSRSAQRRSAAAREAAAGAGTGVATSHADSETVGVAAGDAPFPTANGTAR
jgi:hypothetical protein